MDHPLRLAWDPPATSSCPCIFRLCSFSPTHARNLQQTAAGGESCDGPAAGAYTRLSNWLRQGAVFLPECALRIKSSAATTHGPVFGGLTTTEQANVHGSTALPLDAKSDMAGNAFGAELLLEDCSFLPLTKVPILATNRGTYSCSAPLFPMHTALRLGQRGGVVLPLNDRFVRVFYIMGIVYSHRLGRRLCRYGTPHRTCPAPCGEGVA